MSTKQQTFALSRPNTWPLRRLAIAATSASLLLTSPAALASPLSHANLLGAGLAQAIVTPGELLQTAPAPPTLAQAPSSGPIDISMRPVGEAPATTQQASYLRSPSPALFATAPSARRSDGPDLFGSVALLVGHTPEDSKWMRARAEQPSAVAGPWADFIQRARQMGPLERLGAVNAFVNRKIAYATPEAQYGIADYWATARESLSSGRGNCTAYAIAKLELLRASGVPAEDLYLVLVKDLVRRADHAIVAVRLNGEFVILDSGSDAVLSQAEVGDYRPILTYGFDRTWIHGYRETPREMPREMMADATSQTLAPSAAALQ